MSQQHRATHKAPIQGSASFCYNSDLGISPSLILYVGLILTMGKLCSLHQASSHGSPHPTPQHPHQSMFLTLAFWEEGNPSWL